MHRYFLALVAVTLFVIAGCGSKGGPTTPTTPKLLRVAVSVNPATAPSLTDPNDAVWNGVAATGVTLSGAITPFSGALTGVPDSVLLQGIRKNDTLYLRLRWKDATHDVWPGYLYVVDTLFHCDVDTSVHCTEFVVGDDFDTEDRMLVLMSGLPNGAWDAIDWRALTTGAGLLAEEGAYKRDTVSLSPDTIIDSIEYDSAPNSFLPAYLNQQPGFGPSNMHSDSSQFHGAVLLQTEMVPFRTFSRGWKLNQRLPGFYVDTSLATKTPDVRGSRWCTRAANIWDTTSQTYTVVLCRPMSTGFTDCLNLTAVDSVQTKLGVFDNQIDLNKGGTSRAWTKNFWLVLQ